MIFPVGATSQSVDVQVVDDSGLPVTGLVAATFPAVKYSLAGPNADATITLANLATITTAWASGGLKERGEGVYRLDLPNAVFTTAGVVRLRGEASGKRLIAPPVEVSSIPNNTALLGSGEVDMTWVGLTEKEIDIFPGDDYSPTTRPFRITVTGGPSLAGATVKFVITCASEADGTIQTAGNGTITGSGSEADPYVVTAGRLESEETEKLTAPGQEIGRMVATLSGGDIYTFPYEWKVNVKKEALPS